jgi:hypothetical protein
MIKKTNKSLDGTSFHGATFSATLADLQIILGAPNHTSDHHDKVQNEWEMELEDGTVFSVYDWKEYRHYSDTEKIEWHIGGRSQIDTFDAHYALVVALDTMNAPPKSNLFQSVKSFINSKNIGDTFTTKEFHAAMNGIEQPTWWKKYNKQLFYRSNTYRTYLRHLGFVKNPERGLWKVICHIPAWLDSGHVNSALGYMYETERITWTLDVATGVETNTPNAPYNIVYKSYKGMTRDEIVTKIREYVLLFGILNTPKVEATKVEEKDALAEYKNATAKLAKDLASEIIGDGKSPNVWFVTQSPYYMKYKDGYGESFLLDGFDVAEYSVMFGPFFSYKAACAQYDEIELEAYDGVGTVTIEDRVIGVVKEKFLEERITVDYSYNEIDDSKFYNKSK